MNKLSAIKSCLTLFIVMFAKTGLSADYKMYPGANCSPVTGQYEYFIPSSNSIYNGSSSKQQVYCPFVRDRYGSSSNVSVGVNVKRYTGASDALSCTVLSYSYNGGVTDSQYKSFTGSNGSLYFSVSPSTTYGMYCYLPKYSRVHSYYMYEYGSYD